MKKNGIVFNIRIYMKNMQKAFRGLHIVLWLRAAPAIRKLMPNKLKQSISLLCKINQCFHFQFVLKSKSLLDIVTLNLQTYPPIPLSKQLAKFMICYIKLILPLRQHLRNMIASGSLHLVPKDFKHAQGCVLHFILIFTHKCP